MCVCVGGGGGEGSAGQIFATTMLLHFVICYHVSAFLIPFNFDMQHDHVLKKLNFDLLTPSPWLWGWWVGGGGGGGGGGWGVCGPNICYHAAAFCDSL